MNDWWQAVEDELKRRSDDAPDPWGDVDLSAIDTALTPEPRAFLVQLAETPLSNFETDDFDADADED